MGVRRVRAPAKSLGSLDLIRRPFANTRGGCQRAPAMRSALRPAASCPESRAGCVDRAGGSPEPFPDHPKRSLEAYACPRAVSLTRARTICHAPSRSRLCVSGLCPGLLQGLPVSRTSPVSRFTAASRSHPACSLGFASANVIACASRSTSCQRKGRLLFLQPSVRTSRGFVGRWLDRRAPALRRLAAG